ncbi:substrate-binding domain-containing protein [Brachybacterium sp. Marseille-Q7125]|uniref:substrate-binding domain-containing protein n=1 Tax=Brachybacterium sp. Marseille-Q7125 TaxID=2932815 RepID=UPI001FF605B4|nr:substrate-binding domain-containing protein [Brachybacterium sp. Marseille-Q7125]
MASVSETSEQSAVAAIAALQELPEPPTAVFSSNARTSMLLVQPVARAGFGFVSFGDFPMAAALTPPVCAIDQSPRTLGELAAQRILERVGRPATDLERMTTVLPVKLLERGSCRMP